MPPSAATAKAQSPRLRTVLSFDRGADAVAVGDDDARITPASEDDGLDASFDFAFAPPVSAADLAPADDIFSHGRIVPAYPVFDRRLLDLSPDDGHKAEEREDAASTAPPSADTYCEWAPRSAPGSPGRDRFPKSASIGGESSSSSSSRRWRLCDLIGAAGRSRSDGKDKFAFLHHHSAAPPSSKLKTTPPPPPQQKKQSAVKKPKGVVTEMDMATAHKLFYSKAGAGERRPQQASHLTYRPAFNGLFALGRSQHHHTAY